MRGTAQGEMGESEEEKTSRAIQNNVHRPRNVGAEPWFIRAAS